MAGGTDAWLVFVIVAGLADRAAVSIAAIHRSRGGNALPFATFLTLRTIAAFGASAVEFGFVLLDDLFGSAIGRYLGAFGVFARGLVVAPTSTRRSGHQ